MSSIEGLPASSDGSHVGGRIVPLFEDELGVCFSSSPAEESSLDEEAPFDPLELFDFDPLVCLLTEHGSFPFFPFPCASMLVED